MVKGLCTVSCISFSRRATAESPETENFQMLLSIDEFNSCYSPCAAAVSKLESVGIGNID